MIVIAQNCFCWTDDFVLTTLFCLCTRYPLNDSNRLVHISTLYLFKSLCKSLYNWPLKQYIHVTLNLDPVSRPNLEI